MLNITLLRCTISTPENGLRALFIFVPATESDHICQNRSLVDVANSFAKIIDKDRWNFSTLLHSVVLGIIRFISIGCL